jgi:hypothetical protein
VDAPPHPDRAVLEQRYRDLVGTRLPAAAQAHGWVLRHDHCFGRVLLDDAVGGCWYDALDRRRTAFRQLDDGQLAGAVALGERLLVEGDPLLRELDARSLAWRGKPRSGSAEQHARVEHARRVDGRPWLPAARSANGSGRWRSYQGRWSRPTAWWWVIVPPAASSASPAAALTSSHCATSDPRRAGASTVKYGAAPSG